MNKRFWCDHTGPFVETVAGTVRGYKLDDLYIFHGIKYADAKRFEMPTPVKHHDGIEDAYTYGPVAPTVHKPCVGPEKDRALDPCFRYNFWPEDENCQYVNVWTKSLDENAKKPVMVWIHGGGFATGSSVEQHSYDPSNLVDENDIVVVSLNHRLNILGYFDMSEYGEQYAESRNVGMADIVEALKWVQANIAKFGGDPDNVTLFGQSGGGGKIITLMQMPVADNLYNKVIVQSGLIWPFKDEKKRMADGKATTEAVLKELGLTKETAGELATIPFEKFREAYLKVCPELRAKGIAPDSFPCKDDYFLGNPWTCEMTQKLLNTPLMTGSTEAENYHFDGDFSDYQWSYEEKYARVKSYFGEHTDEMIEIFEKTYPGDDILNLYHVDTRFRAGAIEFLDKRMACGATKTWSYVLDYTFKFIGGMPAYHGSDLPFVFNNTDKVLVCVEPAAKRLGMEMSRCWANFAKYGDPNHEFIPEWKQWEAGKEYSMVFGEHNRLALDFDRELQNKCEEYAPQGRPIHRH